MVRRALVLINRQSRQGGQNADLAVDHLRNLGLEVLEKSPPKSQNLSDVVCRHRDEVDLVVVGGGDGSLNAAAHGLVKTQLPAGILPLGTANDLARTLGIPTNLEQACKVVADGHSKRIDLGLVNGQYFFNVASVGLTVQITHQLSKEFKSRWGVFAYLFTATRVLWHARPFRAEIRYEGQSIQVKTIQITVGNGRHYGGGMTVAEDATIDDARLDLYSMEVERWWQILLLFPALRRGTLEPVKQVRTLQGQEFEILLGNERSLNADGEIITKTPAKFRLCPQAVTVMVPKAKASVEIP